MNEFLLNLVVFSSMHNVAHNFTGPDYQVTKHIKFDGAETDPYNILFQCPMPIIEKYKELLQTIYAEMPQLIEPSLPEAEACAEQ